MQKWWNISHAIGMLNIFHVKQTKNIFHVWGLFICVEYFKYKTDKKL